MSREFLGLPQLPDGGGPAEHDDAARLPERTAAPDGGAPRVPRAPGLPNLVTLADEAAGRERFDVPDDVAQQRPGAVAAAVAAAADLRAALRMATAALNKAGIDAPRADAELLAGHLLGEDRGRVAVRALMGEPVPAGYAGLVEARAARVPLQHLTGTTPFRGLELAVGPGVFVPRPETELVAGAAIEAAAAMEHPLVLDLCTGSGAIAAAVAAEVPGATVHAVELSPAALTYAERNLARTGVHLHRGDARTEPAGLDGEVDVLVSNPPYVPGTRRHADPEVGLHDPDLALYGGGEDGMDLPLALLHRAARLLRPGGVLVMEHDETQEAAMRAALADPADWSDVVVHRDLTGRIRYTTARRGRRCADPAVAVGE